MTTLSGRLTIASIVLLFGLWWGLSFSLPSYLVPSPRTVGQHLMQFATTWAYGHHVVATFFHIAASITAAFLVGGTLTTAVYFFPILDVAVHHRLSPFTNAFSSVGWTILAVVWLGVSVATVLFATTVILVPFVLVNLRAGYETLADDEIEMARSFTRRRLRLLRLVILPMLVPYVFATLRITFGVACQVVLITELFGGSEGLGYLVNLASQEVDTPVIIAVALLMVAAFLGTDRLVFAPLQARVVATYALA